jgi:hypothetical protein
MFEAIIGTFNDLKPLVCNTDMLKYSTSNKTLKEFSPFVHVLGRRN